jgi:hypothetical protein
MVTFPSPVVGDMVTLLPATILVTGGAVALMVTLPRPVEGDMATLLPATILLTPLDAATY